MAEQDNELIELAKEQFAQALGYPTLCAHFRPGLKHRILSVQKLF